MAIALALGGHAVGVGAQPLPRCAQRYEIEAQLDVQRHVVYGHERIHFVNESTRPLDALYFHLYLNAFRDRRSVFMREGGSALRGGALGRPGGIEITQLRMGADADLLPRADSQLIAFDHTQLKVPLATALPPGAALDLEITFRSRLPEIVARSGFSGAFHMLGQWFPKLARLRPNGTFASFPYHGLGEFYADFADYDVQLTVPANFRVAGSGVRVSSRRHGDERTDHYTARCVHDVAYAAYPYFVSNRTQVGTTVLEVFAPRGYDAAIARQLRVASAGLEYYAARYGAYPYPTLTIVIPPPEGARAAAMEYPTLFVSAGPFWALPAALPDPVHDLIVAHELAHQWFSGMLASNEARYPMLDEGLAEWASLDFARSYYQRPASVFAAGPLPVDPFDVVRALFLAPDRRVPSSLLPAARYRYADLARAVYMRPALVLDAVARRFGRAPLQAALAYYTRQQRFAHPTPDALFAAFDRSFGTGFSAGVLEPALRGEPVAPLRPAPAPAAARVRGRTFLADVWFALQAVFARLGP